MINPYILLGIGAFFATLYACIIIFGWARTRRNRRLLQQAKGITMVDTWVLDPTIKNPPSRVATFSLTANRFVEPDGTPVDISLFTPFVAIGESPDFPAIHNRDLILKDSDGIIRHIFSLPSLRNYR